MRVAIDATPLICSSGGIRRYVIELARALALNSPADEIFLLTDQPGWQLPDALRGLPNLQAPLPQQQPLRGKWWSLGLPWALLRYHIDIFHGSDFAVPYLPLRPSVLTVHDLSPWKRPPLQAIGAERVRSRAPHLLRIATLLITPSEAVKRELADHFQIPASRIAATPLAAGHGFQPVEGAQVTEWLRHRNLRQPYLVALAAPQPRKNLPKLLEAWQKARLSCTDLQLVCVGLGHDDRMKRDGPTGLHLLPEVADPDLQTLLSGAVAFVYPSLYEGFGLPVLEAMRIGVPVITSRDAAISEVVAGAALQVDASSTEALRRAIVEVASDPRLRADLKTKGLDRSAQFSWHATALLTRRTYEEAIRRF